MGDDRMTRPRGPESTVQCIACRRLEADRHPSEMPTGWGVARVTEASSERYEHLWGLWAAICPGCLTDMVDAMLADRAFGSDPMSLCGVALSEGAAPAAPVLDPAPATSGPVSLSEWREYRSRHPRRPDGGL